MSESHVPAGLRAPEPDPPPEAIRPPEATRPPEPVRASLVLAGVLLVLAAALVAYTLGARSAAPARVAAPAVPEGPQVRRPMAPLFAVPSLRGSETIRLADFRGQVVVLNFFASWCGPCAIEAADLERTWRMSRGRGVVFLGVAIQDQYRDAQAFLERHGITYPAGFDATGDVMWAYRVTGIPTTVFIDAEGRVAGRHAGIFVGEEGVRQLRARIEAAGELQR